MLKWKNEFIEIAKKVISAVRADSFTRCIMAGRGGAQKYCIVHPDESENYDFTADEDFICSVSAADAENLMAGSDDDDPSFAAIDLLKNAAAYRVNPEF